MPDTIDLLSNLRTYLVAQGLARVPTVAGSTAPLWLEPRLGAPAPGEGEKAVEVGQTIVLAAFDVGGIAPRPYEVFKRTDFIDIWIRTTTAKKARDFEVDLRNALCDRRNWDLSALRIIESSIFRDLQRLGSDQQGYTYVIEYAFERYQPV